TVGEPVTRTIIIDALGLEENMLTEPAWPAIVNARVYPDQPQGISRNDGKWVLGHKEFRYAVVPEKAGELVLPQLTLHWWDTVNDREQTAVLPEERLRVLPSVVVPGNSTATEPPAPVTGHVTAPGTAPGQPSPAGHWRWLSMFFAALWLATTAAYAWQWRTNRRQQEVKPELPEDESACLADLRRACEAGDAARARRALLRWLREYGPAESSGSLLGFAAQSTSADLRQQLLSLDATGFRPGHDPAWEGRELWQAFSTWHKARKGGQSRQPSDLTDLYARR
ncbi:MAG TPA: hypothetical protein VI566_12085, partial [Xanthomonadales bacterium]|nr:hypothetical protein [Xanthomonadales bacterium]